MAISVKAETHARDDFAHDTQLHYGHPHIYHTHTDGETDTLTLSLVNIILTYFSPYLQ